MRRWTGWVADPRNRLVVDMQGGTRIGETWKVKGMITEAIALKYLTKFIVPRKAFGLKDLERYKR
jgi:hypothetical protein